MANIYLFMFVSSAGGGPPPVWLCLVYGVQFCMNLEVGSPLLWLVGGANQRSLWLHIVDLNTDLAYVPRGTSKRSYAVDLNTGQGHARAVSLELPNAR